MEHHDDLDRAELIAALHQATELLEVVAADRSLLHELDDADRIRLLTVAGEVYEPDLDLRRNRVKQRRREAKAAKVAAEEQVLAGTGIRELRAKPVFVTPDPTDEPDRSVLGAGSAERALLGASGSGSADGSRSSDDTADAADDEVAHGSDETTVERHCYVCKVRYRQLHHFYDQMCPPCAELNYAKRTETADLSGRVALLTGGRVKIGYQAGIKLLRAGARLIMSTRFPRDAVKRYAAEPDFDDWADRLVVHGLDLRHTPSVEAFCQHLLATEARLDFIINNACQTVRRPPAFYEHMLADEAGAMAGLGADHERLLGGYVGQRGAELIGTGGPGGAEGIAGDLLGGAIGLTHAPLLSQVELVAGDEERSAELFPTGRLDQDLQQVDLRDANSWRMRLAEVPTVELLEVQLVNAVAPFLLNARLKPLLTATPERDKHVVNVSAVEGQFYRRLKTTRHPHTNMAKAALNMMTRTSAADYAADGIHMNAVDTGWVTDEDPAEIAERKVAEHRFHPPLDIVDGAARIVDPIIDGFNTGVHRWGHFLKDYRPVDW